MSLILLNAKNAEERKRWIALWQSWPGREIYAHPSYVELFAKNDEQVLCLAWSGENSGILYPVIRRPLAQLTWFEDNKSSDLTNAYGYGGPFAWNISAGQTQSFWKEFNDWAKQEHICSSFARLSLFEHQLALPGEGVEEGFLNVVRSLDLDEEDLWREYAHKVRKNVKRARRDGVQIIVDKSGERLDEFFDIYIGTMQRREAADGYYFDRAFFEHIVNELAGQFVFFHAMLDDKMISTELVLLSAEHMYSYLGGTRAEAFAHRPNDLLKHEAILWGRAQGLKAFVLGGGYGSEDGIYRYKLAFAPHGQMLFRTLRSIHEAQVYNDLIRQRREHEARQGQQWQPQKTHFPAYRAPNESST